MSQLSYYFIACLAGAVLPIQALINARLGMHISGPLWAAAASFAIGSLVLIVTQLVFHAPPSLGQISATPLWLWIGGFLGAIYMGGAVTSVSKIGAGAMIALIIVAQIGTSMVIDHFGVLVPQAHPFGIARLIGTILLLSGTMLILRF